MSDEETISQLGERLRPRDRGLSSRAHAARSANPYLKSHPRLVASRSRMREMSAER